MKQYRVQMLCFIHWKISWKTTALGEKRNETWHYNGELRDILSPLLAMRWTTTIYRETFGTLKLFAPYEQTWFYTCEHLGCSSGVAPVMWCGAICSCASGLRLRVKQRADTTLLPRVSRLMHVRLKSCCIDKYCNNANHTGHSVTVSVTVCI